MFLVYYNSILYMFPMKIIMWYKIEFSIIKNKNDIKSRSLYYSSMSPQFENNEAPAKIIGIQFSMLSPEEIRKNSVVEVTSGDTYNNNKPVVGGLFDPRMGVLEQV